MTDLDNGQFLEPDYPEVLYNDGEFPYMLVNVCGEEYMDSHDNSHFYSDLIERGWSTESMFYGKPGYIPHVSD